MKPKTYIQILISKYPLVSFFIMAVLFSWVSITPKILHQELPVEPFLILGAFAGPTLSALIAIASIEGRAGLGFFFRRYVQWRAGIVWWLIVVFGILIALNVVATIFVGPSIWIGFLRNLGVIFPTYMIAMVFGVVLGPLWEEAGWRGFALPRLQRQFGPIAGSIALGTVWAFWHIPGYLGGWMESAFPALLVSCIGFSIIATWVYNNVGGSILLMILLHSSNNAAISVGTIVLPTNLSADMYAFVFSGWIPAIMSVILAGLILLFTKGNLAYQKMVKFRG